jgi:hypothetical protein
MTVEILEGNKARVSMVFTRTSDSAAVDPAVVLFLYRLGEAGAITTLTYLADAALVKDSVGNYHTDIDLTTPGMIFWEWRGTGANQAAAEGNFEVTESRFTQFG